jgi:transcriptional regulator with XRE-family HTH domain
VNKPDKCSGKPEPTFSERLSYWLGLRDMRQSDLARAMEVSDASVSDWMRGVSEPRSTNRKSLFVALGVTESTFYGRIS